MLATLNHAMGVRALDLDLLTMKPLTEGYQPSRLRTKAQFTCEFGIGDRAQLIDGDGTITGVVTAVSFASEANQAKISWVYNGEVKEYWVDQWRLRKVE